MPTSYPTVPGVRFKDVVGFPGYAVGSNSTLWSCLQKYWRSKRPVSWHQLIPYVNKGYYYFTLRRDGKQFSRRLHILVLEAFHGPKPLGMIACHFPDRNRLNCSPDNLMWGTRQTNEEHRRIHGTSLGENNPAAKLTITDVRAIREKFDRQVVKNKMLLAREHQVTPRTIKLIVERRLWSHVE